MSVVEALSPSALRLSVIPTRRCISCFLVQGNLLGVVCLEKVHAGVRACTVFEIDHVGRSLNVIAILLDQLPRAYLVVHLPLSRVNRKVLTVSHFVAFTCFPLAGVCVVGLELILVLF